jgi:hypothetical protein
LVVRAAQLVVLIVLGAIAVRTGFADVSARWAARRWADFWTLKPEVQVSVFQLLTLAAAGLWAFHLYKRRREGQATIRIHAAVRLGLGRSRTGLRKRSVRGSVLFVRLHIFNQSAVKVGNVRATVTLLDASLDREGKQHQLRRGATQDAFLPISGEMVGGEGDTVSFDPVLTDLEPKEHIETEVLFGVMEDQSLVALRFEVIGEQGSWRPHRLDRGIDFFDEFVWVNYAVIELDQLSADYAVTDLRDRLAP